MTLAQEFIQEFEQLSDNRKREVIDFIEFIKQKENKSIENAMNEIITDNLDALKELAK
jgi:metal-responsive CopG/Arc/MetJ family transcriptional regulator